MDNKEIKKQLKELKKAIVEEGIQNNNNLEHLYKIVDIEKDLNEIEEGDNMRYGRYSNYNNSYGRDYYGRDRYGDYSERGSYGRRGYDAKYRGEEYLEDMHEYYGRYEENKERYGANEDTMKSLKYMLESMEELAKKLREDAQSQEEVEMIRQTAQRIANM